MSFRENINRICIQRGTNLTAVVKQVKDSSSFTTKRCKSEHLVFCKTLFRVCYEYRGGRLNAYLLLFCL